MCYLTPLHLKKCEFISESAIHSKQKYFQIFEVKATSMANLPIGTRVCAYWSQKYNHLYPGTISDMEIDRNLNPNDNVNIELDDGDNRDIHVNSIRFLPPNYPLVGKIPIFLLLISLS